MKALVTIFGETTPVLLITPLWTGNDFPSGPKGSLEEFGRAIAKTARSFKSVHVVNGMELIPHDAAYFADGVHPNELGFLHYAINLIPHVNRI